MLSDNLSQSVQLQRVAWTSLVRSCTTRLTLDIHESRIVCRGLLLACGPCILPIRDDQGERGETRSSHGCGVQGPHQGFNICESCDAEALPLAPCRQIQ